MPVASGGAVFAGITVGVGPVFVSFNPADLILSEGDTYPYYRDEFSNGQSRCRNSLNGQFAEDSNCIAIESEHTFSFDAVAVLPKAHILLGGGRRFETDRDLWFGSVGASWLKNDGRVMFTLRGNFGDSYASGLATIGIRIAGRP